MKKTFLLIIVLAVGFYLISGCSKNNLDQPTECDIVGIWGTQLIGETGGDLIDVTMTFNDDFTMTINCEYIEYEADDEPDEEPDEESDGVKMFWKLEGGKICFAYVDIDEDGISDAPETLDWEAYNLKLSSETLELSDEIGNNVREFRKKKRI